MVPTDGEAAPAPTIGGRADSSAYAVALAHGVTAPPIYVVRDLYGSLLLRTDDIEQAIVTADAAPAGAYVDHWRPGERPPLGDPLDLGLSIQQRVVLADRAKQFAEVRPSWPERDQRIVAFAFAKIGFDWTREQCQESIARCAAMFGRES